MPHLANLMIPDANGNHPLSAHDFGAAVVAVISGDFTAQWGRDYLNNVIASNGGSPLSTEAIAELTQIVSNFNGKTTALKLVYFAKISQYSIALERSTLSGMTATLFDTALEIT